MTADPRTLNSAPGKPLSASRRAATPAAGISAGSDALRGAQAGAHGFERARHAVMTPTTARPAPAWARTDKDAA